jgi:UDP-N-acetylmuramyl pentapeptide phosphotransferase/UDP-N-acetylglucosamine-1-phosphate transferase
VKILAIVLIVLGAISLAYGGISYTTREKVLDVGPIEATAERHKTVPLPPVLGGIAIVAGIALLVVGGKKS